MIENAPARARRKNAGLPADRAAEWAAVFRELSSLRAALLESNRLAGLLSRPVAPVNRPSAVNFIHYLVLRQHDLRNLQQNLARLGLSSLGRCEAHVLENVESTLAVLSRLLDREVPSSEPKPLGFDEGLALIDERANQLLGALGNQRVTRIMVTLSTEAADDPRLILELVRAGVTAVRINTARDSPEIWRKLSRNIRAVERQTGIRLRILFDLAGPKLRTGKLEPGPRVLKVKPTRDASGKVIAPARVFLARDGAPTPGLPTIPVSGEAVRSMRTDALLKFRDARGSKRELRLVRQTANGWEALTDRTCYFTPGLELALVENGEIRKLRVGELPAQEQAILLRAGDLLHLIRPDRIGAPAEINESGQTTRIAEIPVRPAEIFESARPGEPVWFDDGKIGGVIREVGSEKIVVEITQAREKGRKLRADRGINLPETDLKLPALSPADLRVLPLAAEAGDLIGVSFLNDARDLARLRDELARLKAERLGVILKIETRRAFEQFPSLLLAGLSFANVGVMIARGDLAVECGFERLAEVQEELLWMCEAAHVPVIWATQVLESLARTGLPSRAEVTDAAMAERAECVMLNKGPFIVQTVRSLSDIVRRMSAHQEKKRSLFRPLQVARRFLEETRARLGNDSGTPDGV